MGGDESLHATIAYGSLKCKELLDGQSVIADFEEGRQNSQLTSEKLPNVLLLR